MTAPQCAAARVGIVGVLVAVISLAVTLQAQQGKVEQELMQLERDWCAASLKNDAAMLGRLLADDYTSVGRATIKGAAFSGQSRWTDTFVRRDGRWRCVATQSSEIKP